MKQQEAFIRIYDVYLPKINSRNLIKPLDPNSSLRENWIMEEYVKSHHKMLTTKSKMKEIQFYKTNYPVSSTNKWQFKNGGQQPTLKRNSNSMYRPYLDQL